MNDYHIQVVGIFEDDNTEKLATIGFIRIRDKKEVIFNPSIKGMKLHWTYHKDGRIHIKNGKNIYSSFQAKPLSSFTGSQQLLVICVPLKFTSNIKYAPRKNSGIFAIDFREFKKPINLSIQLTDEQNMCENIKSFNDKHNHQGYVFWKSDPKLVMHVFEID